MNVLKNNPNPAVDRAIAAIVDPNKTRVLFVCLGNICRSPAADAIMKSLVAERGVSNQWIIDSAGTGGWHVGDLPDPRMRSHAFRRGYSLNHICRQVRESDFDNFDIIIGMDDSNVARLKSLAPDSESESKVLAMSSFFDPGCRFDHVPDPYYDGAQGFETVLDILQDATVNLFDTVKETLSTRH